MNILPVLALLIGQSGYAGSPVACIDAALALAKVTAEDVVVDIGSGDGRVVVLAAKKYGCRAIGIEFDENLAVISRRTAKQNRVTVEIRHEDALQSDLSEATVVFVYHQQPFLKLLRRQLERLRPGTRVIFLNHRPLWLKNLVPAKTLTADQHEHQIYIWTVGACGVEDSPLVAAAKLYPGVRFHEGLRDPYLVEMAQECANLLAAGGERAYWRDGHPNWDSRYRRIRLRLRMRPVEVTAFSWPRVSNTLTPVITERLFYDWKRSPGHWKVVSTTHKAYGDAVTQNKGVWYGAIIVAD